MKLKIAAAAAVLIFAGSCATAPKEEPQSFEYWTVTKKAYFDVNNLLSADPAVKTAALEQYALLVPSSKERTHVFLARSIGQGKSAEARAVIFTALKELSAGAYVIPHLIRAYASNKAAGDDIMAYIKTYNPEDFNRGEIGSLMYSEDKDVRYFSARVLVLTKRAAAAAFPDILKFAFEPGNKYEDYSAYMDIALGISPRAAMERMIFDLQNEEDMRRRNAFKKLAELGKDEKKGSANRVKFIKGIEGALYHTDDLFALSLKAYLASLDEPEAAEVLRSYDAINSIQTESVKKLTQERVHKRHVEARELIRLYLNDFYNNSGRPDAARAVMKER